MTRLSKRLKEARVKSGLSQMALGVRAGIDEHSASARMNQYERGVHEPHFSIVDKLAEVLNVPSAYFYADDDDIAQLLCLFHRLSAADKARILSMIAEMAA